MNYQSVKSNKILFIGDSWVTNFFLNEKEESDSFIRRYWKNNGYTPYFLGAPSRDTQTIIDIWIRYINCLSKNDLLVIFLPLFGRTRLPNKDHGNFLNGDIPRFNNYFIGTNSYHPNDNFLEIWDNQFSYEYFKDKLQTQELINSSNSSILNYTEIINSLYKITPCKKIVHCWDYKKFDSDVIIYREEMTELIGDWETRDDGHWSDEMNIKFMNFLLKYFKNDKII